MTGKFDFRKTYREYAGKLLGERSHDEAMSLGVGGEFDKMGLILADLTRFCGLQPEHFLIDVGCGSGRLAKHLASYLYLPGGGVSRN